MSSSDPRPIFTGKVQHLRKLPWAVHLVPSGSSRRRSPPEESTAATALPAERYNLQTSPALSLGPCGRHAFPLHFICHPSLFSFFPFCRSIGEAGKLSCHEGRPPSGRLPRSTNETRKKDPLPLASKLREPPHNTRRRFIVAVPSHRRPSAPKEGYKRLQS